MSPPKAPIQVKKRLVATVLEAPEAVATASEVAASSTSILLAIRNSNKPHEAIPMRLMRQFQDKNGGIHSCAHPALPQYKHPSGDGTAKIPGEPCLTSSHHARAME